MPHTRLLRACTLAAWTAIFCGFPAVASAAASEANQIGIYNKANAYTIAHELRAACQAYAELELATDTFTAVSPKIVKATESLGNGPDNVLDMTKKRIEERRYDAACVDAYISAIIMSPVESTKDNRFIETAHLTARLANISLSPSAMVPSPPRHAESSSSAASRPTQPRNAARPHVSAEQPVSGGSEPPAGTYTCYGGASAAFINPLGGLGTKEGTGIRFTPGQFTGYVYIMANHRYAGGFSEADKKISGTYHVHGQMLVADSGPWVSSRAIVRYDPKQDVPTIFLGWEKTDGALGCRLK